LAFDVKFVQVSHINPYITRQSPFHSLARKEVKRLTRDRSIIDCLVVVEKHTCSKGHRKRFILSYLFPFLRSDISLIFFIIRRTSCGCLATVKTERPKALNKLILEGHIAFAHELLTAHEV
jgi:hypothetical protein